MADRKADYFTKSETPFALISQRSGEVVLPKIMEEVQSVISLRRIAPPRGKFYISFRDNYFFP